MHIENHSIENLFLTPLFKCLWNDVTILNRNLESLILAMEQNDGSQSPHQYSNVGGWHSPIDLHTHENHNFHDVHLMFRKAINLVEGSGNWNESDLQYRFMMWANINRAGHYNVPHVHQSTWAGVYYVAVEQDDLNNKKAGLLELLDPRPACLMVNGSRNFSNHRFYVRPLPGLMVVFPGWLQHYVHPFSGDGKRISIACNISSTD